MENFKIKMENYNLKLKNKSETELLNFALSFSFLNFNF